MNIIILFYFILSSNASFMKKPEFEPIRIQIQEQPMRIRPIRNQAFVNYELSRVKRYAVTAWQSERSKKMDKIAFHNLIKFMRERTGQAI